jgi:hypothetical protein
MHLRSTIAAILAASVATACALAPQDGDRGTVSALFVEPLPGLLVTPEFVTSDNPFPQWVEVRLATATSGREHTLARVAPGDAIGLGDEVLIRRDPPRMEPLEVRPRLPGLRIAALHPAKPITTVALIRTARTRVELLSP